MRGGKARILAKNVFQQMKHDRIKVTKFIKEFLTLPDVLKLPAAKSKFYDIYIHIARIIHYIIVTTTII